MSLDVMLRIPRMAIFVREAGQTHEITREEWDRLDEDGEDGEVYSANITHNLNTMAEAAGIYQHLWRPEEIQITAARQLIEPLTQGLIKLTANPDEFKKLNPNNGWGDYEGLVRFVAQYLDACRKFPLAAIEVSR